MRLSLHLIGWLLVLAALGASGSAQAQERSPHDCPMRGCLQWQHQDCLLSQTPLPGPSLALSKSKAPTPVRLTHRVPRSRPVSAFLPPQAPDPAVPPLFLRTRVLLL